MQGGEGRLQGVLPLIRLESLQVSGTGGAFKKTIANHVAIGAF